MIDNVPLARDLIHCRLTNPTIVIVVLKKKHAPIICWSELEQSKHRILTQSLNDEVSEVLSLIKCGSLRVDQDLMKVGEYNLAAKLLKFEEKLIEYLLHELVHQSV